jgi:hypothetical protein
MRPKLTDDELVTVRKFIFRHEKHIRWWKFIRWAGVIASAIFIGLALSGVPIVQSVVSCSFGMRQAAPPEEPPDIPATKGDIHLLRMETAMSLTPVLLCSLCATSAMFLGILGSVLGAFTLGKWNYHKEDAVLVKILRFLTEEPAEPS